VLTTIDRFAALRIDGVEVFYKSHTCEQTHLAYARVVQLGLITTGSSDFHAPDHPHFDSFRDFDLCGLTPNLGPIDA
jgi:predicted metal-dependent phosphoesterase TrpH